MRATRANSYKQIFVDDVMEREREREIIFLILNRRMTNFSKNVLLWNNCFHFCDMNIYYKF